ncbi:hypothetical protein ACE1CD_30495 [Aerosakkonema sp. BLCC-F183]|uniref:hypothetical protein n=1 Tax=Aerosakkonema sp. BLCC-F183 TaxID=3342834 RepID=UPI0035B9CF33
MTVTDYYKNSHKISQVRFSWKSAIWLGTLWRCGAKAQATTYLLNFSTSAPLSQLS